jgi:polyhydroxyalkanoate synthesis regulator phasin
MEQTGRRRAKVKVEYKSVSPDRSAPTNRAATQTRADQVGHAIESLKPKEQERIVAPLVADGKITVDEVTKTLPDLNDRTAQGLKSVGSEIGERTRKTAADYKARERAMKKLMEALSGVIP